MSGFFSAVICLVSALTFYSRRWLPQLVNRYLLSKWFFSWNLPFSVDGERAPHCWLFSPRNCWQEDTLLGCVLVTCLLPWCKMDLSSLHRACILSAIKLFSSGAGGHAQNKTPSTFLSHRQLICLVVKSVLFLLCLALALWLSGIASISPALPTVFFSWLFSITHVLIIDHHHHLTCSSLPERM